jgi:phenylalanyl-tRNA synthetase beta chain
MKFTLDWLKDHLQTDAPLDAITDRLTLIGLEVEGVENPAERLKGFTVARILEAKPHPNADKLKVCQVDTGRGIAEVVCGAPNARAGLVGVFAPPGTYIPGSGFTLGKAAIRGVESAGMMCSERELELSQEHDGIIELPASAAKRVGDLFAAVAHLDDPVIEVAITPNRPDCLGVRGIARDLAAAGLGKLKKADPGFTGEGDYPCPIAIELRFSGVDPLPCPLFAGRAIKGVRVGPSPEWMQRRLRAIGLRPINAPVDVTNYVTYDRARPLHVYDAAKIAAPIMARMGKDGERFKGLDGREHAVDSSMCVIADTDGVLGLGGILGGEPSGTTDATTAVFIESAYFDPMRTAATGRKTGIASDARYRFERGIDPASAVDGLNYATKLILAACGGSPSAVRVAGSVPERRVQIGFDPALVQKLSGVKHTNAEIVTTLKKLGFEIEGQPPKLSVTPPSWRPDVFGAADLVEEVVRLSGSDRIPSTPLPLTASGKAAAEPTASQKRSHTARHALAHRGMVEAVTWSFIPSPLAHRFGGGADALRLSNPISADLSDMRPSLLPGLLLAARTNANRGFDDCALFEVGQVFHGTAPEDQKQVAAGVRTGTAQLTGSGRLWDGAAKAVDVFAAKADALAVLAALGIDASKPQIVRGAPSWYHPGRSGAIQLGPKSVLAHFGELHPETAKAMDLTGPCALFEVFLDAVPTARKKGTAKGPLALSDLQPVRRDFAFLLNRDVAAAAVIRAVESADKALIAGVDVFDIFEGPGVGEGKKSMALGVTLAPRDHTLTDAEIDAVAGRIVSAVKKAVGGELRG